jgi:hypothetical protein
LNFKARCFAIGSAQKIGAPKNTFFGKICCGHPLGRNMAKIIKASSQAILRMFCNKMGDGGKLIIHEKKYLEKKILT